MVVASRQVVPWLHWMGLSVAVRGFRLVVGSATNSTLNRLLPEVAAFLVLLVALGLQVADSRWAVVLRPATLKQGPA